MYEIPSNIMRSTSITQASKLVYAVITKHTVTTPEKNLSFQAIADSIGMTEMTAMRSVKELSEKGLIIVKKNSRGWNTYEVLQGKETSEMFKYAIEFKEE